MTDDCRALYLDLLKHAITNVLYEDPPIPMPWNADAAEGYDPAARHAGGDWPSQAHSMIGVHRLRHLENLLVDVMERGVPGDFVEAGVARGGTTIFMRGVLRAYGVTDRRVWVADSFRGLPARNGRGVSDRSYSSSLFETARTRTNPVDRVATARAMLRGTSLPEVRATFERYGLLDDQVRFVAGWFCDSLPASGIEQLALMRLDADLYDSTRAALTSLYPLLNAGGYVVVDDYNTFEECRAAVDEYLAERGDGAEIERIDDQAVFWRKRA